MKPHLLAILLLLPVLVFGAPLTINTNSITSATSAVSWLSFTRNGNMITLSAIDVPYSQSAGTAAMLSGTITSAQVTGLAPVAYTGAYSALTGLPTIPTNTNQLTNGSGYISSSGTASTISGTIPLQKVSGALAANGGTATGLTLTGVTNASGTISGNYIRSGTTTAGVYQGPVINSPTGITASDVGAYSSGSSDLRYGYPQLSTTNSIIGGYKNVVQYWFRGAQALTCGTTYIINPGSWSMVNNPTGFFRFGAISSTYATFSAMGYVGYYANSLGLDTGNVVFCSSNNYYNLSGSLTVNAGDVITGNVTGGRVVIAAAGTGLGAISTMSTGSTGAILSSADTNVLLNGTSTGLSVSSSRFGQVSTSKVLIWMDTTNGYWRLLVTGTTNLVRSQWEFVTDGL